MSPDIVQDITAPYFSEGVLGVSVVVLGFVVWHLWNRLNAEREAHKVEMAAKDKKIDELYDDRLAEAKAVFDIVKTTNASLDAFLVAVRGGKGMA